MKIAAQLYTVREFTQNYEQVDETFRKIKEIGYDAVQLSGVKHANVQEVLDLLKKHELEVCATHFSLESLVNDIDNIILEHKQLGCKYVGLGCFRGKNRAEYLAMIDSLKPSIEKIQQANMQFLYHNHAHEFIKEDGVSMLNAILSYTTKEELSLLPDFFWVHSAGLTVVDFIKQNQGRMPVVHFKDMKGRMEDKDNNMAEIFEGNMDYESIYTACESAGVEWIAIEQDYCDINPFESLKISFENLKKRNML